MQIFLKRALLVSAAVGLLIGLIVLGGLVGTMTIAGGALLISESLQQGGALDASGYTVGWWLHIIGLLVVSALCVVRWVRRRQGVKLVPMAPLWIYGLLHLAMAWLFTTLEISESVDFGASLVAWPLLTTETFLGLIFPVLLLGLLIRALWRWTHASWRSDGRSAQIAAALLGAALIWSAFGAARMYLSRGYGIDPVGTTHLGFGFGPAESRENHLNLAAFGRSPLDPEPFVTASSGFRPGKRAEQPADADGCARWLMAKGEHALCERRAERALPGDGEDIAQLTLFHVCQKAGSVDDLVPYFAKSCSNRIATWVNRLKRRIQIAEDDDPVAHARPWAGQSRWRQKEAVRCIERHAYSMSSQNRDILRLATLGSSRERIASELGLKAATVRQRLKRMRDKLRSECHVSAFGR